MNIHTQKDGSDKNQGEREDGTLASGSDWMQSESTTMVHPFLSSSPHPDSSSLDEREGVGGLNQHGLLVIKDEWTQNEEELDPNAEIIEGRRAVPAFIR